MMHLNKPEPIVAFAATEATQNSPWSGFEDYRIEPTLPSISLQGVPFIAGSGAPARLLLDRHWNEHPQIYFVPDHFVALPAELQMPPAGRQDWVDPRGSDAARINATALPLSAAGTQWGTCKPLSGTASWSHQLDGTSVLQMQGPSTPESRAAGGVASALLLGKMSDLIVVGDVSSGTVRGRGPAEDVGAGPLVEGLNFRFPGDGDYLGVQTADHAEKSKPGHPEKLWMKLTRADGTAEQHSLRLHTLDLESPNWIYRMMFQLSVCWQQDHNQPLRLALMCKDGATASGAVATALYGMECLDALNREDIQIKTVGELEHRLDEFIQNAQARRSPQFAEIRGRPLDTGAMARDLLKAWTSLHGNIESPVAALHRSLEPDEGISLQDADMDTGMDVDTLRWRGADASFASQPSSPLPPADKPSVELSGEHQTARFSRQFSVLSEDSGVMSDTLQSAKGQDSLQRFAPRGTLSTTAELNEAEPTGLATEPAGLEAKPAARQADPAAPDADPATTVLPRTGPESSGLVAPRHRSTLELPATEQLRSRLLHAGGGRSPANVKRLIDKFSDSPKGSASLSRSPSVSPSVPPSHAARAEHPAPRTPMEEARVLTASREAAATATQAELARIPQAVRRDWEPGGRRFAAYLARAKPLVQEMTARTGLIGYLRARLTDPATRTLDRHVTWSRDLMRQVHDDLAEHVNQQAGPSSAAAAGADPQQVAQLARQVIKSLLAQQFESLSSRDQQRWRHRVTGHSERFEQALATSRERVTELPARLLPGSAQDAGPLTGRAARATQAPPVFMSRAPTRAERGDGRGRGERGERAEVGERAAAANVRQPALKTPDQLREMVDQEWAPHWVLDLTRQVAGVGR